MKYLFIISASAFVLFFKHNNSDFSPPFRRAAAAIRTLPANTAATGSDVPLVEDEIQNLELQLARYSEFSYAQFSDAQLVEFNALVRKKAALLKELIFKKYAAQYGKSI